MVERIYQIRDERLALSAIPVDGMDLNLDVGVALSVRLHSVHDILLDNLR